MVQLIYMGKPLTKTKWTDKERYYSYFLQDSQRATTSLVTLFKLSLINGLIEGKVTKFKREFHIPFISYLLVPRWWGLQFLEQSYLHEIKQKNRPFYSCLLSDLAFEWQRGLR